MSGKQAGEEKKESTDKADKLVRAICDGVLGGIFKRLDQERDERTDAAATLEGSLASIIARLDSVETVVSNIGTGKKEVKRATAEKKTGGGAAAAPKKASKAEGGESKMNAMQFFKFKCSNDEEFRARYMDEHMALTEGHDFKNKQGEDLFKAQAHIIWANLTDDTKKAVKAELEAWTAEKKENAAGDELKEDDGEAPAEETEAAEATDEPAEESVEEPAPKPAPKKAAPKKAADAKAAPKKAAEAKAAAPKKAAAKAPAKKGK